MTQKRPRNRNMRQNKPDGNGILFIRIIICIAIISSFIMFKDTKFPNGKTPKDYAGQILTTTVNLPEIIARFKNDAVLPAGADVVNP